MLTNKQESFLYGQKVLYKGVIEDNDDPLQIGRYRVRILGLHSEILEEVPVASLPWAHTVNPLVFGFSSGTGLFSIGVKGTWVWIMLDNNDSNAPVIIGAIAGVSSTPNLKYGFRDPDGDYPKVIGESDFFRIQPKYLDNDIIRTKCGHLIELDNSDGDERIHIMHTTGSELSIDSKGNINIISVKDMGEVITENYSMQTQNGNVTINVNGNTTINTQGDTSISSNANTTIMTSAETKIATKGDTLISCQSNIHVMAEGDIVMDSNSNVFVTANTITLESNQSKMVI